MLPPKKKRHVKQKAELKEEPLESDMKPVKKKQGQGQTSGEAAADNHLSPSALGRIGRNGRGRDHTQA
jgi:hypothetical protein